MTTSNQIPSLHPASWAASLFGRAAVVRGNSGRFLGRLVEWQDRARARRLLADIDERLLADMGIGRAEAFMEAEKPFWRS
ncbi:MAG: DUF1127 domain-containing protein [Alphaproteobacteria bacterium]|nr:DUF1127 domain-containing protein [Alphaproteobacteria bacterium]